VTNDKCFERAFHVNPDPMSLSTLKDGCIRDVNDAFLRAFGYARDAVIGRTVADLGIWANPQSDRPRVVDAVRKHGMAQNLEVAFRTSSGEERTFRVGAAVIDDPAEPLLLMVGVDLTERQRMETALKQSEERYRHFIDDLPLGVVITQGGVIKFTNVALRALIGFTAEELHDKPFLPFVHEADRPWLVELHQRRMRGEATPDSYECRFLTRQGALRHWRLTTRTIDWDGPAGYAVVTDITELKQAEAQQRLAASVFDHSHEGIMITDADANLIAVNGAFTRLTGYGSDEVLLCYGVLL